MKNLHLKIFSAILAILLFRFVNGEGNSSVMGFTVPIELRNLPQDRVVLEPAAPRAQISIKGPAFLVSSVAASPPSLRVKVPSDVGNSFVAALRKNDLAVPPNVQVLSIDPADIKFTFDTLSERELPVELTNLGALKSSLKVDEITINPSRVKVRGPSTKIKDLVNLQTELVDLRDVAGSFGGDFALRVPTGVTEISVPRVRVDFKISVIKSQKKFVNVPVEIRSLSPEKFWLSPASVSIEVSGVPERMAGLKMDEVIPFVRIGADAQDAVEVQVATDAPREIAVVQIDPPKVRIVRSGSEAEKKSASRKVIPLKKP